MSWFQLQHKHTYFAIPNIITLIVHLENKLKNFKHHILVLKRYDAKMGDEDIYIEELQCKIDKLYNNEVSQEEIDLEIKHLIKYA